MNHSLQREYLIFLGNKFSPELMLPFMSASLSFDYYKTKRTKEEKLRKELTELIDYR